MTQPYRIIVGLEVHAQLLTRTKLFCGCLTKFGAPPNTQVCPVCLGMPGVLPVMNRKAFELSLRAALALNCQIARFTKWDRKNYYYPDLPKNFQTSQYDMPFSHDGWLDIDVGQGPRKIGIIRAHLEEDAGKNMHDESGRGGDSKVDLNRTGTPLLEIVSHPDLRSADEAKAYLEEVRLLLREIGASDCEMQEGSLRCDANVNIHIDLPDGTTAATPLVEVKNLNSISSVGRAIEYEAARHWQEYQKDPENFLIGKKLKTTAGWNDLRGETVVQRHKESLADYRFFPEPDLVPAIVSEEQIEAARAAMGELPAPQRARLQTQYGLSPYDADVLMRQGRALVGYYERTVAACGDAKAACNWVTNEVMALLKKQYDTIDAFPISAENLGGFIREIASSGLNMQRAREVYAAMLEGGIDGPAAIAKLGFQAIADEGQLLEYVRRAMAANPKAVADFKKGKVKAADAIKGAVMRETKGMAKTETVQALLMAELEKAD